ncbi:hypothetical protein Pla52n_68740 [Stieleria varia]|uniref:Uncharacterized protein n=1 Tax=Stieleria varia TaxID=2528005 RepID=A0A5C5ZPT2_9BACT|nr:hypothetical protein Pla52n_68740 [Stieleria varia]
MIEKVVVVEVKIIDGQVAHRIDVDPKAAVINPQAVRGVPQRQFSVIDAARYDTHRDPADAGRIDRGLQITHQIGSSPVVQCELARNEDADGGSRTDGEIKQDVQQQFAIVWYLRRRRHGLAGDGGLITVES